METIRYEKSPNEHPVEALKREMPWLLSPGADAETMDLIARVIWRKAVEWTAHQVVSQRD